MAATQFGTVLHHLRRLAGRERAAARSDAELLEQFRSRRDEAAFAALLQRHGPMVWGVCRRILRDDHAAEDAFQATFLVFVRKAGSVGKAESLGYWLYEVAFRTALRAKVNAARRRTRERQAPPMPDTPPPDDLDWRELRPIIDAELHRLPEHYRRPFVLCYLDGKTHGEAAALLGWPKGTVSGRLARARELLRKRLARHGITLSAATLANLVSHQGTAAVPAPLLAATLRAGMLFAAGRPAAACATAGAVPLAQEVLRIMSPNPLKFTLALLLVVGICAGVVALQPSAGEVPAPPQQTARRGGAEEPKLPAGATARMGGTAFRHGDRIQFVAYTPDGKKLVTAAADETVRVWDAATGRELLHIDPPPRSAKKPQPAKGIQPPPRLQFGEANLAALSPDGKLLAQTRDGVLYLWDLETGKERPPLSAPGTGGMALAFADVGKSLRYAGAFKGIDEWDVATGARRRRATNAGGTPVRRPARAGVALSGDGELLARPQLDQVAGKFVIAVTDTSEEKRFAVIDAPASATAVAFSPDKKTLAWGLANGTVTLWDIQANQKKADLAGASQRRVLGITFSRDGKSLALSREDGSVELWDVPKEVRVARLTEPSVPGGATIFLVQGTARYDLAFRPDGRQLAVGAFGSRLRIFDTGTGKEVGLDTAGHPDAVRSLGVLADGKTLVSHGRGDAVRFWDLETGKERRHVLIPGDTASAALAPDGSLLAVAQRGMVVLYDPATGREKVKLTHPNLLVGALSFSSGGKVLALREDQGQVRLWGVATGKTYPPAQDELPTVKSGSAGITPAAPVRLAEPVLSPDGKLWVAADANSKLALYETESGIRLGDFELEDRETVRRAAFTPDARGLVTVNQDGTLTLFETATLRRRARFGRVSFANPRLDFAMTLGGGRIINLQGGSETPFAVAFSHDGRILAANPSRGKISLWDVLTGKGLTAFHGHQGGVASLTFSADDRRLISGSLDGTVLVWDTAKYVSASRPDAGTLGGAGQLWPDLAGGEAEKAFAAVRELVAAPAASVALLKQRLKPVPAVAPGRLSKLINDLDAKSLSDRQKAVAELEKLGDLIRPAAQEAIARGSTLETRQRLEHILAKLRSGTPPPETLGALRGVEALEYLATTEARQLLQTLADGAPGARQTEAARSAIGRLDRARKE